MYHLHRLRSIQLGQIGPVFGNGRQPPPNTAAPWQLISCSLNAGGAGRRACSLGFSCHTHRDALKLMLSMQHALAVGECWLP